MKRLHAVALAALGLGLVTGCRGSSATSPTNAAAASPFSVAIEGSCPKLHAQSVGEQTVVVLGTYGLDEGGAWTGRQTARAAQALALVNPKDRTAEIKPALLEGLPKTTTGWADGDLEVGGSYPSGAWLERTLRTPAATNKGALFETTHDAFAWSGHGWQPSAFGRDAQLRGPHTTLPTSSILCDNDAALSLLASERAPDGTTFVAGRCEDELHRPNGPLLLARYDIRTRNWQRIAAPSSVIFEGPDEIVNAGIVAASADEAFVYAYRPFVETERERPYLVKIQGHGNTASALLVALPFVKSIVSLARAEDETLWAIVGFAELRKMNAIDGRWSNAIPLPQLGFVEPIPAPANVRLLEVQTTKKNDVWVHGAVPIVREDGTAGREHVLYTTAPWSTRLHCDREKAPAQALAPNATRKVKLGTIPTPKRSSSSEASL